MLGAGRGRDRQRAGPQSGWSDPRVSQDCPSVAGMLREALQWMSAWLNGSHGKWNVVETNSIPMYWTTRFLKAPPQGMQDLSPPIRD